MPTQALAKTRQKVTKRSGVACSCVMAARAITGINVGPIGYARNHPINSRKPRVGSIVVLRSGWTGHVAAVTAVHGNSITIKEGNWRPCQWTTRTLSINSKIIRGYYL